MTLLPMVTSGAKNSCSPTRRAETCVEPSGIEITARLSAGIKLQLACGTVVRRSERWSSTTISHCPEGGRTLLMSDTFKATDVMEGPKLASATTIAPNSPTLALSDTSIEMKVNFDKFGQRILDAIKILQTGETMLLDDAGRDNAGAAAAGRRAGFTAPYLYGRSSSTIYITAEDEFGNFRFDGAGLADFDVDAVTAGAC